MSVLREPGPLPEEKYSPASVLLSVIIVTYQSQDEIGACLSSIPRRLCGGLVEMIVVDNCSTDQTLETVRKIDPQIKILASAKNLGFGRANNLGYQNCRGEFILFLNPDTELNHAALENCLGRLRAEAEIGIISPKLVLASGEMDLACRRSVPNVWDGFCRASSLARLLPKVPLFSGYNLTYLPDDETYTVGAVNGAFMMTSRRVLQIVGLFDETFFMYGEDLDLCLRCSQKNLRVVYDGRCSVVHLKGRSSTKEYRSMSNEVFVGTKHFYLKHFNRQNSRWVRYKYEFLFWLWRTYSLTAAVLMQNKTARPL